MKQKLKCFLIFLFIACSINNSIAQSKHLKSEGNNAYINSYFGLGIGLDYGGIGIQAEYLHSKYVGFFAGAGYALIDPAFNAGVSAKLLPDKKFCPTITAMYGYNAVIKLKDFTGATSSESKIYYGLTIGASGEIKTGKNNQNKLTAGIRLPFRNNEFHKDYDALKDAGYKFTPDFLPITFSVGISFGLSQKK